MKTELPAQLTALFQQGKTRLFDILNHQDIFTFIHWLDQADPWFPICLFLGATGLMIWRLEAMERKGFAGTILGTLLMPYCSGLSNLAFAFVLGQAGGNGAVVLENCLVNNVTNLTLLLGLPAAIWPLQIYARGQQKRAIKASQSIKQRLDYLSLMLTLIAVLFFTGVTWALARDQVLDFGDGLVLVGIFLFWQIFHIFDVLKTNVREKRSFSFSLLTDAILIICGGWGTYISIERLVAWIPEKGPGLLVFDNLGWLSGLLMVLPNALLAFYYAGIKRADIVYSSQAGDGHICIPMCIGLFAIFTPITVPPVFSTSMHLLIGAGMLHLTLLGLWGRLPRFMGAALTGSYAIFFYFGFLGSAG